MNCCLDDVTVTSYNQFFKLVKDEFMLLLQSQINKQQNDDKMTQIGSISA